MRFHISLCLFFFFKLLLGVFPPSIHIFLQFLTFHPDFTRPHCVSCPCLLTALQVLCARFRSTTYGQYLHSSITRCISCRSDTAWTSILSSIITLLFSFFLQHTGIVCGRAGVLRAGATHQQKFPFFSQKREFPRSDSAAIAGDPALVGSHEKQPGRKKA